MCRTGQQVNCSVDQTICMGRNLRVQQPHFYSPRPHTSSPHLRVAYKSCIVRQTALCLYEEAQVASEASALKLTPKVANMHTVLLSKQHTMRSGNGRVCWTVFRNHIDFSSHSTSLRLMKDPPSLDISRVRSPSTFVG